MPVIIFINGFLAPKGYVTFNVPSGFRVITVNPSCVSSLHDRVMQLFYQLKGGTIHFGEEHSKFHGHCEYELNAEPPLYPEWDADNPVHIVGHSFGGLTARVLQHYIAEGNAFHGYTTNSSWIHSVVTICAPLNGSALVYPLGANASMPPIVRWGSFGYTVGAIVHLLEYLQIPLMKRLQDFKMDRWRLGYEQDYSFVRLVRSWFGLCVHSTTDIASYDMTLQSQDVWHRYLQSRMDTFYLSIVGTNCYSPTTPLAHRIVYFLRYLLLRNIPSRVLGIEYNKIQREEGFDGMLFSSEQSHPRLQKCSNENIHSCDHIADSQKAEELHPHSIVSGNLPEIENLNGGMWYVLHREMDHTGVNSDPDIWITVFDAITKFDQCSRPRMQSTTPKYQEPITRGNFCVNNKPDMQIPVWVGKPHSEVHLSCVAQLLFVTVVLAFTRSFCFLIYSNLPAVSLMVDVSTLLMTLGVSLPLGALFLFVQKYSSGDKKKARWLWTSDDIEMCFSFFRIALSLFILVTPASVFSQTFVAKLLLISSFALETVFTLVFCRLVYDYYSPISKTSVGFALTLRLLQIFEQCNSPVAVCSIQLPVQVLLILDGIILMSQALWSLIPDQPTLVNNNHSSIAVLMSAFSKTQFYLFWVVHWVWFLMSTAFCLYYCCKCSLTAGDSLIQPLHKVLPISWWHSITEAYNSNSIIHIHGIVLCLSVAWILLQKFRSISEVFQITTLQRREAWF